MSIQHVGNFYVPNVSSAIKIMKKDLKDQTQEEDCEMKEESNQYIQLEFGITDFWTFNASYKNLVISAEIANIDNKELLNTIKLNLMNLYDFNFRDEILWDSILNEENGSTFNNISPNDIEVQVVLLKLIKHYWSQSIAAKTNLTKIKVNKIIAKYKRLLKMQKTRKLKSIWISYLTIKDHHIEQMKKYVDSIHNTPVKIEMIKNAVWPKNSETKPPWNSTISKILKNKLNMSYKVLHKWNIKRKEKLNKRVFIESLYLQTKLRTNEIEIIYIDEFKFSSRN